MKTRLLSFSVAVAIFVGPALCQTPQSSSLNSLVESERAFAAMSVREGMRSAFLAFLADDGILFRPGPVNGKGVWEKRPIDTAARLEWEPIYADVSASGDLGYTTGPWIFTPGPDLDQPPAHGFFVSVWKKQKNGKWKLAVDLGIGNEHPEKVDRTFSSPNKSDAPTATGGSTKSERVRLMQLEKRLSQVSKSGTASAITKFAGGDIRLYREGDIPSVNREQACAMLSAKNEQLTSRVEKCFVASSCDLAYTYGQYDATSGNSNEAEAGYFVRIWKKNRAKQWELMLDILTPTPKQKE